MEELKKKQSILVRLIKWSFILGISFFIIFALGVWIITTFYADEIKQQIAKQVNHYLAVPVDVKEIDFTVWRTFPLASVDFKEVTIYDGLKKDKTAYFLKAKDLYFSFNVLDVINKNYKLRSFSIENGEINLIYDERGNGNYKFWKETKNADKKVESYNIHLKKISGHNIKFNFLHKKYNQTYKINLKEINFEGQFSESNYSLKSDLVSYISYLNFGGINYISNKHVSLNLELDVANNLNYTIKTGDLIVSKVPFKLSGIINNKENETYIDLVVSENKTTIEHLLSVLPEKYTDQVSKYKGKGNIKLTTKIKGILSDSQNPDIRADFDISDAQLNYNDVNLSDFKLAGFYSNGSKHTNKTSILKLNNFSGKFQSQQIKGELSILDFDLPTANGNVSGKINLADLGKFIDIDTLNNLKGELNLDLDFSWPLHGAQNKERILSDYQTTGFLNFKNVNFGIKQRIAEFVNLNADLVFNNQDIKINSLQGKVNQSDFILKGYFENIIPYFTGLARNLTVDADLISNNLELDEILAFQGEASNDTYFKVVFPEDINFNIKARIGKFKFNKFIGENLTGNLTLQNRKIATQDLGLNGFDGFITLSGLIDGTDTTRLKVSCQTKTEKLNVSKMFYQLENFGQEYLTDKNIKGNLTAETEFQAVWSSGLVVDQKSIIMHTDVTLENGELNDYSALLSLSKFIEVSELKQVKFSTLKNQIDIKDCSVTIPMMEIKSSAINISLAGTHSFDQFLDYHFKVALKDLLANKARKKKENNEFGEFEEEGKKVNLFIHVKGYIDDLKFSYDKKGFKEQLKNEISNEKNTVKALLKEEFGLFKKDTSIKAIDRSDKRPPLEVEWQEDGSKKSDKDDNKAPAKKSFEVSEEKKKEKKEVKNKTLQKILKEKNETENIEDIQ
jgi:hypothetical protein